MKPRKLAYAVYPLHTWFGYKAPPIMIDAQTQDGAKRAAYQLKGTLPARFPDKWIFTL